MAEAELNNMRNVNRSFDGRAGADIIKTGTAEGTECTELLLRELERVMSLVEPALKEIKRLHCQPRLQSPTELHAQLEKATTENARLQQQITEIKNTKYTEYDDLFKKLQQANTHIQELEASKRNSEAELINKHKDEINAYKEANCTTKQRLQEADKEKEELKNMNAQLKSEALKKIREQEQRLQETDIEKEKLKNMNAQLKSEASKKIREQKQELQEADKEKEKLKNMNAQLKSEASKKIKEQEQEIARLSQTIKGIKEERKKLEEDLNDTKTRLSKLMGDKLADKNPDIADLSDNNRPTKIAEKYQELYDNQWTDAFEVADQCFADMNEKNRIEILKTLLLNIHSSCEKESVDQNRQLMQALYRTDKVTIDLQHMPDAIRKAVKEMKRQTSTYVIDTITKKIIERVENTTTLGTLIAKVNDFVQESVIICWHMLLQDPPLAFDLEKLKDFDSSKYKAYTTRGSKIDFVVWPPLLLHKGGPILTKGIAQCVRSFQGSNSVRSRSRQVSATELGVPTGSLRISRKETTANSMELLLGVQGNENTTEPVTKSIEETITSQMSDLNLKGRRNVGRVNQETFVMSKNTDNQTDMTPEHHQSGKTYTHTSKSTHDNSEVRNDNTTSMLQNPIYSEQNQPSQMHQSGSQMKFASDQSAASHQHQSPLESSATNQYNYTQQNQPLNDYRQHTYQNPTSQQTHNTSDYMEMYQQQSADHSQTDIVQTNQQAEQLTLGQYPPELTPTEHEWQWYVYYMEKFGTPSCRQFIGEAVYDKCQKYNLWLISRQNF